MDLVCKICGGPRPTQKVVCEICSELDEIANKKLELPNSFPESASNLCAWTPGKERYSLRIDYMIQRAFERINHSTLLPLFKNFRREHFEEDGRLKEGPMLHMFDVDQHLHGSTIFYRRIQKITLVKNIVDDVFD
jgi:hypothetical protein